MFCSYLWTTYREEVVRATPIVNVAIQLVFAMSWPGFVFAVFSTIAKSCSSYFVEHLTAMRITLRCNVLLKPGDARVYTITSWQMSNVAKIQTPYLPCAVCISNQTIYYLGNPGASQILFLCPKRPLLTHPAP